MKAKMIAVAVAGMLVGCGSGGGSVEFQSQKGEPEVLIVNEVVSTNGESLVQEEKPEYLYQKGEPLTQEQLPEGGAEKGPSLVQQEQETYHVNYQSYNGSSVIRNDGEIRITQHGESFVQEENPEGGVDKGTGAIESVEELAICQREGLQEQENCEASLSFINTGMSEAKAEFDKDPHAFQIQATGFVGTAENSIKRDKQRAKLENTTPTYAEVIEFLVKAVAEDETMESRYIAAGQAIAAYYYVRGIPEGHTQTGNPGLCADKGLCGDVYLKYQWN